MATTRKPEDKRRVSFIEVFSQRAPSRLNYSNIVATIALFIALGGASYAAVSLPPHSVGTRQLKAGAVTPSTLGFPLGASSFTYSVEGYLPTRNVLYQTEIEVAS